ncbi:MAG: ferredoxin [Clostridiales bacterium]|nr:MAG: ferredoxin [Clostridiales bacterium]
MSEYKPKIIEFLCNWCSYAGADLAGTSRTRHDITARAVRVMCSGRVEPSFVLKAFLEGADGVLIAGCHIPSDCHYTNGNFKTQARYEMFQPLLDQLGIDRRRLRLEWISASEGEKFANVMDDFSAQIKELGKLEINKKCPLQNKEFCGPECPLIQSSQEFVACEAAAGGHVDLQERKERQLPIKTTEPSINYDPNKCIRCGSCVEACRVQSIEAIHLSDLGVDMDSDRCVRCGQCVMACPLGFQDKTVAMVKTLAKCDDCAFSRPVGAMSEVDDTKTVIDALKDPDVFTVVQFAPSVRTGIGEQFGMEPGANATAKLYSAFRAAGFDRVWDTNFSADLTIMEEGTEFLNRVQNNGVFPQFTSCCPAWVKYVEKYYPQLIPNLSSAKSPQQMFGAVAKTYGAKNCGVEPKKMFVVSVMPCTAKKYECQREEFADASDINKDGKYQDVDAVLTIRECAKLFKLLGIDLSAQKDGEPDPLMSAYTGAATIFGRTGGVMTAALRTAYEIVEEKPLQDLDLQSLGTYDGVKTASVPTKAGELNVAVAYGLGNAKKICEDIISGGDFSKYHFIEIMSCPGGCVGGGGQILTTNVVKAKERTEGLNEDDHEHVLRKSHENPEIKKIYDDFLEKPCSHLAHDLLHTEYVKGNV